MNRQVEFVVKQGVVLILLISSLSGCGTYVMMGSKTQSYQGRYTLDLPRPRADIMDRIAKAGESMGYRISGMDEANRSIKLASETSFGTTYLIGKMNRSTLTIKVGEEGKLLDIDIYLFGNLGSGRKEAADELFEKFKSQLLKRLDR
ncbi:MAG: hypothetical protein A3G41_06135 [Elusimicrobia bacterium RIFCSPLOWO2_12_FULL_59_9]|nr:MAG: hypothetical protein A3G41_06135 [Elusimicrobia bacterium RIFCSPLOWO2_12_FULL_59_9]